MNLYLTPQFLQDLRDAEDAKFLRRVLDQIIDKSNSFKRDQNDHRYHGIEDAWIRYISGGRTAYRLIYIQRNDDVFLYRAGAHSIEDRLSAPRSLDGLPVRDVMSIERNSTLTGGAQGGAQISGDLLKTSQPMMLSKVILGLTFVGHREIFLVSPYLSQGLLDRQAPFGRFLDKAIEERAAIVLITKPSEKFDWMFYEALESRGIMVHFHAKLHTKLFVFDIDETTLSAYNRDVTRTAILGSANLTDMGFSLGGEGGNEELCYRLPSAQFYEAREHAYWLMNQSVDFVTYRNRATRRF